MRILRRIFFSFAYLKNPPWDTGISPPELMDFIRTNPPGKALDLGCGTGTNLVTLASYGWKVTGVDFVPTAVWLAKKRINKSGYHANIHNTDVTNLTKIKEKFDLIIDIGCFHSVHNKLINKYANILKQYLVINGTYLLYGFINPAEKSPGLTNAHLDAINMIFKCVNIKNGENHNRPSAWFTFINIDNQ